MPNGPQEMVQAIVRNLPAKTLDQWVEIVKKAVPEGGMNEKVAWLRGEHDLGTGTARVIASAAEGESGYFNIPPPKLLEEQYAGPKKGLRPVCDSLAKAVKKLGKDATLDPRKTYVSVNRSRQFAVIQATTKDRVDLGLALPGVKPKGRLKDAGSFATERITHQIALASPSEVDDEVIEWLQAAYDNAE